MNSRVSLPSVDSLCKAQFHKGLLECLEDWRGSDLELRALDLMAEKGVPMEATPALLQLMYICRFCLGEIPFDVGTSGRPPVRFTNKTIIESLLKQAGWPENGKLLSHAIDRLGFYDDKIFCRYGLSYELSLLNPDAVEELANHLTDRDAGIREGVAWSLALMGTKAEKASKKLMKALERAASLYKSAHETLTSFGSLKSAKAREGVEALRYLLPAAVRVQVPMPPRLLPVLLEAERPRLFYHAVYPSRR